MHISVEESEVYLEEEPRVIAQILFGNCWIIS